MNATEKFTLSESLSKGSKNENMSLTLNISGNKLILPESSIDTVIDSYDIYLNERANSNKFRLTISINPYCSNVLFNPFTEIIKHYKIGDTYRIWQIPHDDIKDGNTTNELVNEGVVDGDAIIGKDINIAGESNNDEFVWNTYKAIRDTQLSNDKCGFEYFCGVDIFNNHVLRNKSYKTVTFSNSSERAILNYREVYGNSYDRCVNGSCEAGISPYSYDIDEFFNTIDDYMRDRNGIIVSDELPVLKKKQVRGKTHIDVPCPLHLYQRYDIETYNKTIKEKLIEENGWFGFKNNSLIDTASIENYTDKENNINLAINNKKYGEFIDMYPTRDLFTFSPLYNKYKQRLEKNWNYYLTYPSESVTEMLSGGEFPFFNKIVSEDSTTTALKVLMIDEYTVLDNGRSVVTIYTICQHGLTVGDRINLYVSRNNSCKQYKISNDKPIECEGTDGVKFSAIKVSNSQESDTLFYNKSEVVNVLDKYTFQIYKTEGNISNKWIDLNETKIPVDLSDGRRINYTNGGYALTDGLKNYPIAGSNRCNVDDSIESISIKRVSNGVECEYYVRMFSRLPNFKFVDSEITDETLYGESSKELDLINRYSTSEFENHISNESFARTSYGDINTEIVFTDDIDVSYLRDNLGRPLSDIYLTVVKNNEGYKNWYGVNNTPVDVNVDTIEQSHCFGKNNSSFLLSDFYRETIVKGESNPSFNDVRDISIKRRGLLYKKDTGTDDEIDKDTLKYYGDICCYSPIDCDEQSIQTVHNRFNTVQRELSTYDDKSTLFYDTNGSLYYDEVQDDESGLISLDVDDESNLIDFYAMFNTLKGDVLSNNIRRHSNYVSYLLGEETEMDSYSNLTKQTEGYYYKTHYKIKLKTISKKLNIDEPTRFEIYEIYNDDRILNIKTVYSNGLEINDKLILYVKSKNIFYYLTVKEIITDKYFTCTVQDEKYVECTADSNYISDIENISLLKKADYVPYYARIIKDGSCRFYWRNVLANGIEEDDSKIYPFTNGAFYINKNINFYLKRQDPSKSSTYSYIKFDYVPKGDIINWYDMEDESYYEANEIEECNFELKELLK